MKFSITISQRKNKKKKINFLSVKTNLYIIESKNLENLHKEILTN